MYSALQRINAVLSFSMSTCVTLGCIIAALTPLWNMHVPGQAALDAMRIDVNNVALCVPKDAIADFWQ
jgi:hypothetical protein